ASEAQTARERCAVRCKRHRNRCSTARHRRHPVGLERVRRRSERRSIRDADAGGWRVLGCGRRTLVVAQRPAFTPQCPRSHVAAALPFSAPVRGIDVFGRLRFQPRHFVEDHDAGKRRRNLRLRVRVRYRLATVGSCQRGIVSDRTRRLGSRSRATVVRARRGRHTRELRTVLNVSLGPSLVQVPSAEPPRDQPPFPAAPPSVGTTRFNVAGSAALSHDMSRSWNLGTSFRRGAGSIDGLASNAATLDLRGLLARRVELVASAGYFQTDLGTGGAQNQYTTKFGSSRLQVALTRAVAIYGQYVFYDYD